MIRNKSLFIRRTHRYLGLFIGIQFLGWTISGLYFSWNNIDNVHGDHMRKNPHFISVNSSLASPEGSIQQLKQVAEVDSIHSIQLISILGKPIYQILYFSGHTGDVHHHVHYRLADASTGELRERLSKDEAIAIAKDNVVSTAKVKEAILIENNNGNHEYRERPLPAYAVSF